MYWQACLQPQRRKFYSKDMFSAETKIIWIADHKNISISDSKNTIWILEIFVFQKNICMRS